MTIKGMDGQSYNVTGQGQGNTNTVLGALGAASFLGINAGNVLGGGCGWNPTASNTRYCNEGYYFLRQGDCRYH